MRLSMMHSSLFLALAAVVLLVYPSKASGLSFEKDKLNLDAFTYVDNLESESRVVEWQVHIEDLTESFAATAVPNALRQMPGHISQHPGDPSCIWFTVKDRRTRTSSILRLGLDGSVLYAKEIPYGQAPLEMTSVMQLMFCGPTTMGIVGQDKVILYKILPDKLKLLTVQKEALITNTFIQSLVSMGTKSILFNKAPGFHDGKPVLYRDVELIGDSLHFTKRHTVSTNDAKKVYGRFWDLSGKADPELREELLYQLYRVQLVSLPNDFLYFNADNGLLLSSTHYTMLRQDEVSRRVQDERSPVPRYDGIVGCIRANTFSGEYWIIRSLTTPDGKYRPLKAGMLEPKYKNFPTIDVLSKDLKRTKVIRLIVPQDVYSHFAVRDVVFVSEETLLAIVSSKKHDSKWETRLVKIAREH